MSSSPSNPTHYEVLDVSPSLLSSSHGTTKDLESQLLKRAYHRALLRHHPDKAAAEGAKRVGETYRKPAAAALYTVDQITTAYTTLGDPKARREYDLALRQSTDKPAPEQEESFRTGFDIIDLDDLQFDEAAERWYMDCRCGNERGFQFGEEVLDEREREVFVGCQDCSLWIKVQYEVAP
ncbi:Diphthamide biosynthesis protein 4 [Plectosphaerella plurivora]|uniref:Diphthamide biosynthesis protein 4 n=1 Tax=Plectosphaerella plurivora TaxID=936078 RepID=A0A9P9ADX9_9PEZI|nr:Diphthamide biosynthesis protein 4 [Plectosphaerella plurivora]